jgi:hypothetical protein
VRLYDVSIFAWIGSRASRPRVEPTFDLDQWQRRIFMPR